MKLAGVSTDTAHEKVFVLRSKDLENISPAGLSENAQYNRCEDVRHCDGAHLVVEQIRLKQQDDRDNREYTRDNIRDSEGKPKDRAVKNCHAAALVISSPDCVV